MKKLLTFVLLLACGSVWAQDVVRDSVAATAADTADNEENVIGAKPTPRSSRREANVLGAPVYYNQNGSLRCGDTAMPYRRPKHHYLNNLEERYHSIFAEGEVLRGNSDYAFGLNFTYLPKRWGAYGSVLLGARHDYLSVGPALRLSDYDSYLDWQLYGGIMFGGRSTGAEVGLRIATPQHDGEFCITSASMGMAIVGNHAFVTFGASIGVMAAIGATTLLFW